MKRIRLPHHIPRFVIWLLAIAAVLVVLLFTASYLIEDPLRRKMVKAMNGSLQGYSVRLEKLDLHPIGFSVTLKGLTIRQDAYPDPPVAVFPQIDASVYWRSLFSGRLVSDWQMEEPRIHINLDQLRQENRDEVPVQKRGWQQAFEHIYPLKLDLLQIRNGAFTYIEGDRPVELTGAMLEVGNIRNVRSPQGTYPSPIHLTAAIFGKGRGEIDGNADFLAEPHPAVKARFSLNGVPLEELKPVSHHANLIVTGGMLSTSGEIEYAPAIKSAVVEKLEIEGIHIDYIHTSSTAGREKRQAKQVKEAAREAANKPGLLFLVKQMRMTGEAGFVSKEADPSYRLFLSDMEMNLSNLSNQFREGPATVNLRGKFMGSGKTTLDATFRSEEKGPDFDLDLKVEKTRLTSLNDLLRAYSNVDVVGGTFSLYSEMKIGKGRIDGYVKPLLDDVDVYDRRQDKNEGILKKVYEKMVEFVSGLLENEPRKEVATRVDISGPMKNPETSTLHTVLLLIQNGFFKAILPGFEREVKNREK